MSRRLSTGLLACLIVVGAAAAEAQPIPGFESQKSRTIERVGNYWKLTGEVELLRGESQFYAEHVEIDVSTRRLVATGNVLLSSPAARIAAERLEYDYAHETGTFFTAWGSASLGDRVDRSMFGTQEPDVYFYGETVQKVGPRKYRVTKGAFTTCVQPTPRWELASSTVTLTLDEYAILTNARLRVKGVPVLYVPVLYYPIQDDDRATGFLLPVYGTSTIRGQSLSNAFFWAIDRSQDATFFHDWFAKTGQGMGAEYRYVAGAGSDGSVRTYWLNEHEATYENSVNPDAEPLTSPARRSYELRGGVNQVLPWGMRGRARVDYFSNVTTRQIYHQNVYDATERTRAFGGSLTARLERFNLTGTYERREVFFGEDASTLYGSAPRVMFQRPAQRIAGLPLYASVGGEVNNVLFQQRRDDIVRRDAGLWRVDVTPSLRAPLSRLQFLTVNSSVAWRNTYYSESLEDRVQVPQWLARRYFDLRADVIGPVFTRIWNTPGNAYAERFKHVVEPSVNVQRVTSIENRDEIVLLNDGSDYVVGGTTRLTYGLTNRFLAKSRGEGPRGGRSREFLTVAVFQTYYTNEAASQFDQDYSTSFRGREPSNFSPVSVGIRATPTLRSRADVRMEYDPEISALQSLRITGSLTSATADVTAGYSQRRLTTDLLNPDRLELDNFVNASTALRTPGNRVGGMYSFNYDIGRSTLLQQRLTAYYNAQCCGFAVEYQTFNFPNFERFRVPQDRRFNFSVTLAGIGTFANPFGSFGGPGRQ